MDPVADPDSGTVMDSGTDAVADPDAATVMDAGTVTGSGTPSDASVAICVDAELVFGFSGGFVAYVDRHTLDRCDVFAVERTPANDSSAVASSCESTVAPDAEVSIADVNAALADGDVEAALTSAPVLYGYDARPVDGPLYAIEVDGARIEVGGACGDRAGCTEIPAGVDVLRALLQSLVEQQLGAAGCEGFP
jgi:hypothetical protein